MVGEIISKIKKAKYIFMIINCFLNFSILLPSEGTAQTLMAIPAIVFAYCGLKAMHIESKIDSTDSGERLLWARELLGENVPEQEFEECRARTREMARLKREQFGHKHIFEVVGAGALFLWAIVVSRG